MIMTSCGSIKNKAAGKAGQKSWGIQLEEKELLRGTEIKPNCNTKANIMLAKIDGGAVDGFDDEVGALAPQLKPKANINTNEANENCSSDNITRITNQGEETSDLSSTKMVASEEQGARNARTVSDLSIDNDSATAGDAKSQNDHQSSKERIRHWEEEALAHFNKSAWEEVIRACNKVLEVPGQLKTNFNVLFQIGYAYMRVEQVEYAAIYFRDAYRINSHWPPLRLAIGDLKRKGRTGQWRERSQERVSSEQQQRQQPNRSLKRS